MAPSAVSTDINTPMPFPSKAPSNAGPRDVATSLNYQKHPGPGGIKPIDSSIPPEQRRFVKRDESREFHDVVIKDVRSRKGDFKWDVDGFQYLDHEITGVTDWSDPEQMKEIIQPATEEIVKKITGASRVVVHLTRYRDAGNSEGGSMDTARSPSHGVHTDVTISTVPFILKEGGIPDDEIEHLLKKRFMVANLWRPCKTVLRDPLGVCAWSSVDQADIFTDRREGPKGIMEFALPVFNERHEWHYLSEQRPDEPLLFKQLDSHKDESITLLHSAFVDPKYKNYPPRESIEVKMVLFFDEE